MVEINYQTYIKVPNEKVYETLTTSSGWNAWFTDETTIQLNRDGTGEIKLRWTSFGLEKLQIEDGGKIIRAIPNKEFMFEWKPGDTTTTVSFQLQEYKEGCLVKLNEKGYGESERDKLACINCAAGWGEALTLLKMYLEHGIVCKEDLC